MFSFRYLVRRFQGSLVFTAFCVLTLGLGIGANTAIFSMIQGILLKPLPFQEEERLISLMHLAPGIAEGWIGVSQGSYFTYREDGRAFEDIALYRTAPLTVTRLERPERVHGLYATHRLLPLLRIAPLLGRGFTEEEDSLRAERTVLLSHSYWQRRFGSAPGVLGRQVQIDGLPWTVIGVLPAQFDFLGEPVDLILPFRFDRSQARMANFSQRGIARLKPGVTLESAAADIDRMIPLSTEKFPRGLNLRLLREAGFAPFLRPLKAEVVGDIGEVLWLLLGTVGIVLLIGCANVTNLLLVRSESRHQEFGVRKALGASRFQVAVEIMGENLGLGLAGGAVGVAFAVAGIGLLKWIEPNGFPRLSEIAIDSQALLFALSISLLTVVLFGSIPLIRMMRLNVISALKDGARGVSRAGERHTVRNVLVASQVALAFTLLIGSGLTLRSFQRLLNVSPGFQAPEDVLTMRIFVPEAEIPEAARVAMTHRRIQEAIGNVPGVVGSGIVSNIPLSNMGFYDDLVEVEDFPVQAGQMPPGRRFKWISPGYLETMGIPLLAGRPFNWNDVHNLVSAVLVNESFARLHWPHPGQAVGKRLRESLDHNWREIVGVIGDVRDEALTLQAQPTIYWPLAVADMWGRETFIQRSMSYAIRLDRTDRENLSGEIREAVWSVNGNLAVANMTGLDAFMANSRAQMTFALVMLAIAATGALLLAVVGIYGVISHTVSQRTREIGIRVALGAERRHIRALVARHGALLIGSGVAVGLGCSYLLTMWMSSLLFEVGPLDPLTYVAVTAMLTLAALAAGQAPARRAARVDPIEALRWE